MLTDLNVSDIVVFFLSLYFKEHAILARLETDVRGPIIDVLQMLPDWKLVYGSSFIVDQWRSPSGCKVIYNQLRVINNYGTV